MAIRRRGSGGGGGGGGSVSTTKIAIMEVVEGTPAVAETLANNTDYSAAHGLGAVPSYAVLEGECTTAEKGYAVGDRVLFDNDKDRESVWYNATTIGFVTHASNGAVRLIARAGNAGSSLTPANWTVRAIPYLLVEKTVVTDVEASGVGGGGGGAGDVLLNAELGTPNAAKVGRIRNFAGHLFVCKARQHAGYTGSTTWSNYSDGDGVGVLYGESVNTYRYRGERTRGGEVVNPMAGDLISLANGSFERYSSLGPTGWFNHAQPDGWIGRFENETAADAAATAIGESSAYANQLHAVTAITAGQATHTTYLWEPYFPPRKSNPAGFWYIHGQTVRWPATTYPYEIDPVSNNLRLRWASNAPNEDYSGFSDIMADIWVATANVSSNIDAANAVTNTQVFTLPPGRYDITALLGSSTTGQSGDQSVTLLEVSSGADDRIIEEAFGFDNGLNVGATARLVAKDIVLAGTEQLYLRARVINATEHFRGYLRIEKLD